MNHNCNARISHRLNTTRGPFQVHHNFGSSWRIRLLWSAVVTICGPVAVRSFPTNPHPVLTSATRLRSFQQTIATTGKLENLAPFSTKAMPSLSSVPRSDAVSIKEEKQAPPDDIPSPPWKVFPSWQYDALIGHHGVDRVKLIYVVRHAEGTHNVNRDYKSAEQLDARLTPLGVRQCLNLRDELLQWKNVGADRTSGSDDDESSATAINDRLGRCLWNEESLRYNQHAVRHLMDGMETDKRNNEVCVVASPLTRCIQTALHSFDFFAPVTGITTSSLESNDISNPSSKSKKTTTFLGFEALRETVNYNCDRRRRISVVAKEFPQIDFSSCSEDEDEIWMSYRRKEEDRNSSRDEGRFYSTDDNEESSTSTPPVKKNYLESAQLYVVANRGRQALEFLESLPQSKIIVCTHSAYLRCILNWGQTGGVPKMFEQRLDDREDPNRQDKLFDYCTFDSERTNGTDDDEKKDGEEEHRIERASFENYMRQDYENAELRSFCLLVQ